MVAVIDRDRDRRIVAQRRFPALLQYGAQGRDAVAAQAKPGELILEYPRPHGPRCGRDQRIEPVVKKDRRRSRSELLTELRVRAAKADGLDDPVHFSPLEKCTRSMS